MEREAQPLINGACAIVTQNKAEERDDGVEDCACNFDDARRFIF
jgi:hypothetical protein